MPEGFETNMFPVGRGAQGSSIFFIPATRLKESSPEPALPSFSQDGSLVTRPIVGSEKIYGAEQYVPRNRQSIGKSNKSIYTGQSRMVAFDRLVHSKPEDLLAFARQMFRQTSVPDSGKRVLACCSRPI